MSQALSAPEDRARLERALAIIRAEREREQLAAAEPHGFLLSCACAVHDRAYALRFKRNTAGGKLYLAESVKLASPSQDTGNPGGSSGAESLDLSEFNDLSFPCPWCGDESLNRCDCGLVCGGRTQYSLLKGWVFHCRPSCGAVWIGTPMKEIEGTSRREEKRGMTKPQNPLSASPASGAVREQPSTLAGREPLRLPAGKNPSERK